MGHFRHRTADAGATLAAFPFVLLFMLARWMWTHARPRRWPRARWRE